MKRLWILFYLLITFCAANVNNWDVLYAQGSKERDRCLHKLEEKKAKYVILKRTNDIYEIRYKESN